MHSFPFMGEQDLNISIFFQQSKLKILLTLESLHVYTHTRAVGAYTLPTL